MPKTSVDRVRLDAWRSFLTAHADLVDRLGREMESECGIPLAWYEVLLYLHDAKEQRLRMHELADSLLLSRSAATRFVDRMESGGLVCRTSCESDRRGTFVALTDEGRSTFAVAAPIHLRGIEEHFARRVSRDEAEVVSAVMSRLTED